ncbi:hypothetical protein CUPS4256_01090 [Campylobacter upsaliensis]|uniref:hypothetical protein n=1 Tax=Campylobacter upsaliensis TaxID=28080 RepID=UPI002149CDB6|nr:hypothetical protein [Campylobacter upsaliensis]MCR2101856.1 hypothetical protein [Campylobacter upsaliensis]MCR2103732.1 hypothetical protein [Campylobacter upsaliensis]
MESFANNALKFHSLKVNLLGELERHFKEDFVFERFLSAANGTVPSLFYLYFNSPIILTKSKYFKTNLTQNPTEPFTKQGYEVIFLTSGNRTWYEFGAFLEKQDIEVIDAISLLKDYPNAQKTAYGILDEFLCIIRLMSFLKQHKNLYLPLARVITHFTLKFMKT